MTCCAHRRRGLWRNLGLLALKASKLYEFNYEDSGNYNCTPEAMVQPIEVIYLSGCIFKVFWFGNDRSPLDPDSNKISIREYITCKQSHVLWQPFLLSDHLHNRTQQSQTHVDRTTRVALSGNMLVYWFAGTCKRFMIISNDDETLQAVKLRPTLVLMQTNVGWPVCKSTSKTPKRYLKDLNL